MSGPLLVSYILLWVLVVILAVALLSLYNHFGKMYLVSRDGRARQGPNIDERLPAISARDLSGKTVTIPPAAVPSLLFFASTTCTICAELLGELERFASQRPDVATVVICGGKKDAVRAWARDVRAGVLRVIPDPSQGIAIDQRIVMTPFVVAIDNVGVVRAKGLANDRAAFDAYANVISPLNIHISLNGKEAAAHEAAARVGHSSDL